MYALVVAAITSIVAALLLTPLCRSLAIRWGWLDQPDSKRKTHSRAIPRVGGIPIFLSYLGTFAVLLALRLRAGDLIQHNLDFILKLFPAAALIFIVGLLDDIRDLRPWQKLLGQLVAAVWAYSTGLHLSDISGLHLGVWWTFPVTILWLVGCSNAFNLIDGVDGLSAGIGFFATLTTIVAALLRSNVPLALATMPLAGALLGFLRYNSNPATIYLGDSGSLLIGFLLGCYSILWSGKSATVLGMTAPLMVLAIPLLDTALAVVRRYLTDKPLFGADRGHIHHKLLARGFTPRRVAYLMYGFCGLGACFSLVQSMFHERFGAAIVLLFCGAVCLGVRYLGYAEFDAARRIVFGGSVRRLLNAELELSALRDTLSDASTADECWNALRSACYDFGFHDVRLKLAGHIYSPVNDNSPLANAWTIRIELSETEYVNLSCKSGAEMMTVAATFADTIGETLRTKASQFRRLHPMHAHEIVLGHAAVRSESTSLRIAG